MPFPVDPSVSEPDPAIRTLPPLTSAYFEQLVAYAERSAPELGHSAARALVAGVVTTHTSVLQEDPAAWKPTRAEPGGRSGGEFVVPSLTDKKPVAHDTRRAAARSTAGGDDVEPVLSIDDPLVRSVITIIMCTFYGDRLTQYAEGCLAWQRRTTAVEPADLVQTALGLLLAGHIARSVSTEDVLPSLLVTIRNLGRSLRRHERFAETDSHALDRVPDSVDVAGSAFRALLETDIRTALSEMPAERRSAVMACLLEGMRATEYATARGIAASTVRNHLLRGRSQLREALSYYRPDMRDAGATGSGRQNPGGDPVDHNVDVLRSS